MFIEIDNGPIKGKATRIPVEAAVTTIESYNDEDDDAPSKQDDYNDDEDEYDKRLEASAADDKDDEVDKGFIITQSRAECLFDINLEIIMIMIMNIIIITAVVLVVVVIVFIGIIMTGRITGRRKRRCQVRALCCCYCFW